MALLQSMKAIHRRLQNARLAGVFSLSVLILPALLSGCAAPPELSPEAETRLPAQAYVTGVPFHSQRDYQCGPASLAMALNASGVDIGVEQLIPQVFVPGREGSVQPEMMATVRRHQRISYPLDGSFDALLTEVNAGHPVVVLQNLSLPLWPMWHYAVAIGYDREREQLILHSGEQSRQVTDMSRFDATWARSGRWAMVALPPGQLPLSTTSQLATDSIAAFETSVGAEAALPAWQALVERWPEHAMGWFALGNALHASGDPQAAVEAFEQATEQDAGLAVAWLNLGLTQKGLGQRQQAIASLRRAAALPGRWQAQAEQTLTELAPPSS
ncbi:PA2778 family cysteine peptidase [Oceanisphaera sp. KMM 10153]|uniref:PA2778 family cysteine peptidase n=1 Tax=Oceanisphaera submarina TaxID=3390193 RepID=UPI003975E88B